MLKAPPPPLINKIKNTSRNHNLSPSTMNQRKKSKTNIVNYEEKKKMGYAYIPLIKKIKTQAKTPI